MTTYYVSTTGSDTNAGTSAAPWKTLQHAADTVAAGDVVRVAPGEYDKFTITTSGNASNYITFEAENPGNKPRIKGANADISDSTDAPGANSLSNSSVYVNGASYIVIDGFEMSNQRSPALGVLASGANYEIIFRNCYLYRVKPVVKLNQPIPSTGNATRSPIWIQGDNRIGSSITGVYLIDNSFIECIPRGSNGNGTEVVTFYGNLSDIMAEGNYFKDCQGINLNFLGNGDSGTGDLIGQPTRFIARGNTFVDAVRYDDGVVSTTQCIYSDRSAGYGLIEDNLMYAPGFSTAGVMLSYEPESDAELANQVPSKWFIVRNNVMISGRWAFIPGTYMPSGGNPGYTPDYIYAVHNVLLSASGASSGSAVRTRRLYHLRLLNNVMANYDNSSSDGLITNTNHIAGSETNWTAKGNLLYSVTNRVVWGGTTYTVQSFDSTIQAYTGFLSNPVFVNGISFIASTGDYTGYTLDDWKLAATSAGYGGAQPLTTVDGNQTGTSIILHDAGMVFGGNTQMGEGGDLLRIGSKDVTVTVVDYATNTITVDASVTVSDGDAVFYRSAEGVLDSVGLVSVGSGTGGGTPPSPATAINYLENPSFDQGTDFWLFNQGDGVASWSVSGGTAEITVTTAGTTIQLYQVLSIAQVQELMTSLWMQSDDSMGVTVNLIKHQSPYTNLGLSKSWTPTASCATYTTTFTPSGAEDLARLQIFITGTGTLKIHGTFLGVSGQSPTNQCPVVSSGGGATGSQALQVAASGDDWSHNSGGYFSNTGTIHSPGGDKDATRYDYHLGMIFGLSTNIPAGSTITSATIEVYRSGSDSGAGIPDSRIWGIAALNPTPPTSSTESKTLTKTSAYVDWTMANATSEWKTTADISSIIEELMDLGSLNSGTDVGFFIGPKVSGWGGTNTMQYVRTYDYGSTYAPKLNIAWTEPGGASGHYIEAGLNAGLNAGMED